MTTLPRGTMTLYPYSDAEKEAFEVWPEGRVLVAPLTANSPYVPVLTDDWQLATDTRTNLPVFIRRADCGAGCRCAGEVRLATTPEPCEHPFTRINYGKDGEPDMYVCSRCDATWPVTVTGSSRATYELTAPDVDESLTISADEDEEVSAETATIICEWWVSENNTGGRNFEILEDGGYIILVEVNRTGDTPAIGVWMQASTDYSWPLDGFPFELNYEEI